ncbi:MAG: hypothetical protein IKT12_02065, partial [Thermoguttaceae bacterium]|nr:hypothetical protein [Thermoguttaceae bacterium]
QRETFPGKPGLGKIAVFTFAAERPSTGAGGGNDRFLYSKLVPPSNQQKERGIVSFLGGRCDFFR